MCTYVTSYTEWRNIRTGECSMNNILQYGRGTIYLHFNNKQLLYSDTWQNRDSLNGCKKWIFFFTFSTLKKHEPNLQKVQENTRSTESIGTSTYQKIRYLWCVHHPQLNWQPHDSWSHVDGSSRILRWHHQGPPRRTACRPKQTTINLRGCMARSNIPQTRIKRRIHSRVECVR